MIINICKILIKLRLLPSNNDNNLNYLFNLWISFLTMQLLLISLDTRPGLYVAAQHHH
jgi:hypothetical protein